MPSNQIAEWWVGDIETNSSPSVEDYHKKKKANYNPVYATGLHFLQQRNVNPKQKVFFNNKPDEHLKIWVGDNPQQELWNFLMDRANMVTRVCVFWHNLSFDAEAFIAIMLRAADNVVADYQTPMKELPRKYVRFLWTAKGVNRCYLAEFKDKSNKINIIFKCSLMMLANLGLDNLAKAAKLPTKPPFNYEKERRFKDVPDMIKKDRKAYEYFVHDLTTSAKVLLHKKFVPIFKHWNIVTSAGAQFTNLVKAANRGRDKKEPQYLTRDMLDQGRTEDEVNDLIDKLFRSYEGGFCTPNKITQGTTIKGPVYHYDISSAYPYEMSKSLPCGENHDDPDRCFGKDCAHLYVIKWTAKLKPDLIRKLGFGLINTRQFWGMDQAFDPRDRYPVDALASHEMELVVWEDTLRWLMGYYENKTQPIVLKKFHFRKLNLLKNYIERLYLKKQNAKTDELKLVIKIMLNAPTGKLGMNPNRSTKLLTELTSDGVLRRDVTYYTGAENKMFYFETKANSTDKYNNVAVISYITAEVRHRLFKLIYDLQEKFVYCDTDSVVSTEEIDWFVTVPDKVKLGDWELKGVYRYFKALQPKTYLAIDYHGKVTLVAAGQDVKRLKEIYQVKNFCSVKCMFNCFSNEQIDAVPTYKKWHLPQGPIMVDVSQVGMVIGCQCRTQKSPQVQSRPDVALDHTQNER